MAKVPDPDKLRHVGHERLRMSLKLQQTFGLGCESPAAKTTQPNQKFLIEP
jgi:hypothetical protein